MCCLCFSGGIVSTSMQARCHKCAIYICRYICAHAIAIRCINTSKLQMLLECTCFLYANTLFLYDRYSFGKGGISHLCHCKQKFCTPFFSFAMVFFQVLMLVAKLADSKATSIFPLLQKEQVPAYSIVLVPAIDTNILVPWLFDREYTHDCG